ncbi:unnamed protein product, partial [Amoebophrya sp. A25]
FLLVGEGRKPGMLHALLQKRKRELEDERARMLRTRRQGTRGRAGSMQEDLSGGVSPSKSEAAVEAEEEQSRVQQIDESNSTTVDGQGHGEQVVEEDTLGCSEKGCASDDEGSVDAQRIIHGGTTTETTIATSSHNEALLNQDTELKALRGEASRGAEDACTDRDFHEASTLSSDECLREEVDDRDETPVEDLEKRRSVGPADNNSPCSDDDERRRTDHDREDDSAK